MVRCSSPGFLCKAQNETICSHVPLSARLLYVQQPDIPACMHACMLVMRNI